jgi:uncharacterized membrane protein YjdF
LFFSTALLIFLVHSIRSHVSATPDVLIALTYLGLTYAADRRFRLSTTAVTLLCTAILLHPLGVFGLYSHFLLFGVIGYDKAIHFFISFSIAYAILDIPKNNKTSLTYAVAVLIVMGLGCLIEITEFVGEVYFGMDNSGIFTMADPLPSIKSDLQRHDTHFDMIFNLLGSVSCALYVMAKTALTGKKQPLPG